MFQKGKLRDHPAKEGEFRKIFPGFVDATRKLGNPVQKVFQLLKHGMCR